MKPRFFDAMGEALTLVRKSNLAEATALIRNALAGEESSGGESDPEALSHAQAQGTRPRGKLEPCRGARPSARNALERGGAGPQERTGG